jgi:transposase
MSLYGIDLHANNSVIVLLNEQDEVIYQKRLPNALPAILEPLGVYAPNLQKLSLTYDTHNSRGVNPRLFCM